MDLQVGSTVGDYQVVGILGAGGMGKVYKVRNVISDRTEALKVLLPDLATEPELADRFLREIKVQASLVHPNIAALHTALRVDNQLLMLMELVEGVTLEQKLKEGPLPPADAVNYVMQVLAALDYAHTHGVIHRDIKPANMMLTPAGAVKLMDFGIAKAATDRKLTMTGTTLGSLYYMSPEQIQGALTLDARSDLYSVGVSLYELVTGKRPFDGDSQFAIMSAHLEKAPVPPVTVDPRLPKILNDIILMSVAKDAGARFQSAAAFRNALTNVTPAAGAPPVPAPRPAPVMQAAPVAQPNPLTQPAAATQRMTQPVPLPPPPPGAMPAASPLAQTIRENVHFAQPTGPPPAKGKRGLWMGLGAVAAALVLIAAIEFGPWKGTKAAPQQVAAPPSQTTAPPTSPQTVPPTAPQQAAGAPQQAAGTVPPSASTHATPPAGGSPAPLTSPAATSLAGAPGRQQLAVPPRQMGTAPPAASLQPPPQTPAAGTSAVPEQQAPPAAAKPPAASRAELQEAREQLSMLGVRASGIRTSLQSLQRSQAAGGMNLRGDMQDASTQMTTYLDGANAALNDGNPGQAKTFMEKAERQIEKLEKFLNR